MISLCKKYEVEDKEIGLFVKMNSDIMSNMKTMLDSSDSHIAKMMIEGTNKGLVQLEELLNHYDGFDEKIREMIEKILDREKENYE